MEQRIGAAALAALALAALVAVLVIGTGACKVEVAGGQVDGRAIYLEVCARCHGAEGTPDPAMARQFGVRDLRAPAFQDAIRDADLRARIAQGSANRRMPAFAGALEPAQIDAVAAYVRTLRAP
jgi:cytochrome c6